MQSKAPPARREQQDGYRQENSPFPRFPPRLRLPPSPRVPPPARESPKLGFHRVRRIVKQTSSHAFHLRAMPQSQSDAESTAWATASAARRCEAPVFAPPSVVGPAMPLSAFASSPPRPRASPAHQRVSPRQQPAPRPALSEVVEPKEKDADERVSAHLSAAFGACLKQNNEKVRGRRAMQDGFQKPASLTRLSSRLSVLLPSAIVGCQTPRLGVFARHPSPRALSPRAVTVAPAITFLRRAIERNKISVCSILSVYSRFRWRESSSITPLQAVPHRPIVQPDTHPVSFSPVAITLPLAPLPAVGVLLPPLVMLLWRSAATATPTASFALLVVVLARRLPVLLPHPSSYSS